MNARQKSDRSYRAYVLRTKIMANPWRAAVLADVEDAIRNKDTDVVFNFHSLSGPGYVKLERMGGGFVWVRHHDFAPFYTGSDIEEVLGDKYGAYGATAEDAPFIVKEIYSWRSFSVDVVGGSSHHQKTMRTRRAKTKQLHPTSVREIKTHVPHQKGDR